MANEIKLTLTKNSEDIESNALLAELLKKIASLNNQVIKLVNEKAIAGPQGVKGEQGETGVSNTPGPQGQVGLQGLSGVDGVSDIPGEPGKKGEKGKDGKNGRDGVNGSPDTSKQILAKLKGQIDTTFIKGFDTTVRSLQKSIQNVKSIGGGGMGNVIHQQFDGDGSTTSFTLSSDVAGAGTAVYACRYEGQVQHLGDQFTISGKTLTFTFTPANNTKIEITYSRS